MNRILIVEDENMTARVVKKALELNNMEVEIAENGEEGINLIKEREYDLILLDLKMPKMGGEEVLKIIRQVRPYVFVIIYTNFSEFTDIKALVNIGIDGYINKGADADLQELVNMIKEKLEPFSVDEVQNIMDGVNIQKKE